MTHASVFSGIGGPEVAATMLGWENLFHCEINEFGRRVLEYWFPNSTSYEDITKTDFSEWRGRVNVLTGGFPCQPFSYAGKRGGAQDDRYLWPYMFRCIDQVRPDWVVAENVAGILTMVEQGEVSEVASAPALFDTFDRVRRYQLRETFTLQRICDDLEGHGYAVQPVLVPACGVGAPHRRDRVFIIGHRIDADTTDAGLAKTRPEQQAAGTAGDGTRYGKERHEVRKPDEPNQVRPASATIPEDSMHIRREQRPNEEQGSERHIGDVGAGDSQRLCRETSWTDYFYRLIADSRSRGQSASELEDNGIGQTIQREEGVESFDGIGRPCTSRCSTDTDREGLEGAASLRIQGHEGRGQFDGIRECTWDCGESIPIGRWDTFPSVSPVHRGNDGLPFDVDRLTISFGKWRTEALKAYGNAIVPQVMYEIFRAIEITDKTLKSNFRDILSEEERHSLQKI